MSIGEKLSQKLLSNECLNIISLVL